MKHLIPALGEMTAVQSLQLHFNQIRCGRLEHLGTQLAKMAEHQMFSLQTFRVELNNTQHLAEQRLLVWSGTILSTTGLLSCWRGSIRDAVQGQQGRLVSSMARERHAHHSVTNAFHLGAINAQVAGGARIGVCRCERTGFQYLTLHSKVPVPHSAFEAVRAARSKGYSL
jgi:hypothetical protein